MIYLDNSATTQPFEAVVACMSEGMRADYFNPSALYQEAAAAEKRVNQCRERLKGLLCADALVYTAGGTEANNLALLGVAQRLRKPGMFLISAAEHPSVLNQRGMLEAMGHRVRVLSLDEQGLLRLDGLEDALTGDVALVSIMQVSNETGAVQPLREVARLVGEKAPAALLHVDGVQGFLRKDMQMRGMGVDLFTLSGHKIHGPKGVGALAMSKRVRLEPRSFGGGQEMGFRSGTENTPGIWGLDAAVSCFQGLDQAVERMRRMKLLLFEGLAEAIPGLALNGPLPGSEDAAPHILNISLPGIRGEVMVHALESHGILVGTGSACSSKKRKLSEGFAAMGLSASRGESAVRVSLGALNTEEEIMAAIQAFRACYQYLKPFQRR